MASLCKRQQCTIERRGFRQELDSWRHKLIHCVGFESILEGLFGPGLVKDITLFQDCEPEEVADWSLDENCLFCCLRPDKVKDHSVDGPGAQLLSPCEDSRISRLERQAQDFLNAVFHRKDLPSFSDPHIPLVAREIMQRMIRQFAAEYTSKTTQDDLPLPNGTMKDQSLSPSSSASSSSPSPVPGPALSPNGTTSDGPQGGTAASAQNPVLSKLLLDQDTPLDLTVKKSPVEPPPGQQDGVLDLSTKKTQSTGSSRPYSGVSPAPVPVLKSRSLKVEDVEEEDGLLPRSLHDPFAPNNNTNNHHHSFKPPPLARSLRIREELLNQKHCLLNQPSALSLSNLESAALLNHSNQPSSLLGAKGSYWGSKAHLESLMKLKQASSILSLSDLKDLPSFLENHHHHQQNQNHHHHHQGAYYKSALHSHHHNQLSKSHHGESKREQGHSPPVDLKIPQVRGMDLSWDSHASELYGYGSLGVGGAGGHGDNSLSRKLRAILPKQNRRSLGSLLDGAADYWTADLDHNASGPAYSTSDVEGDPNSKQPRKKRGRYRQYNSEILEEAIAVVMSGKMSVSKAQNMYGIPHSTLEYKVKERMGTLKNPPKKKLKLMMKMEGGGDGFANPESENTPLATPREEVPPSMASVELKDNVKMEMEDNFKPID
ncbi:ligand-dependent corepressor [Periophthalmus magnuspinnatus]|uniref:ligand-dependent corepressor n=1 Tax=Periophthalmus magnuspinnatus TaxID=409849 RepID=UPI00145B7845|nr:ligand-dependent corepressor [Periophthalmus magnuspinnatus]